MCYTPWIRRNKIAFTRQKGSGHKEETHKIPLTGCVPRRENNGSPMGASRNGARKIMAKGQNGREQKERA